MLAGVVAAEPEVAPTPQCLQAMSARNVKTVSRNEGVYTDVSKSERAEKAWIVIPTL